MGHVSTNYLRLLAEKAPTQHDRDHFTAIADEIEKLRTDLEWLRQQYRLAISTLLVLTDVEGEGTLTSAQQTAARDQINAALRKAVGR